MTYSLKSTPNDRFYEKLFMEILFTLRVFARNLLRGTHQRNIFSCFVLLMSELRSLIHISNTYSLKSTPNDRFCEKLFIAILFLLRVFTRKEKKRPRNIFSYFVLLMSELGSLTHNSNTYLCETFHGNFIYSQSFCQKTVKLRAGKFNTTITKYVLYIIKFRIYSATSCMIPGKIRLSNDLIVALQPPQIYSFL